MFGIADQQESQVDAIAAPPRFLDENERSLELGKSVWLTETFTNTLYRVKLVVKDRLAVDIIIGGAFLNGHVVAILCTENWTRFIWGSLSLSKN